VKVLTSVNYFNMVNFENYLTSNIRRDKVLKDLVQVKYRKDIPKKVK